MDSYRGRLALAALVAVGAIAAIVLVLLQFDRTEGTPAPAPATTEPSSVETMVDLPVTEAEPGSAIAESSDELRFLDTAENEVTPKVGDCIGWREGSFPISLGRVTWVLPCGDPHTSLITEIAAVPASGAAQIKQAVFDACFAEPASASIVDDNGTTTSWNRTLDDIGFSTDSTGRLTGASLFVLIGTYDAVLTPDNLVLCTTRTATY